MVYLSVCVYVQLELIVIGYTFLISCLKHFNSFVFPFFLARKNKSNTPSSWNSGHFGFLVPVPD